LADKSTRLIRDALSRAAVEPDGCVLVASKSEPGLFPSTTLAKSAADRCKADGFLQVVRIENKGKAAREICAITEKGRDYLVRQSSPRDVLEDFLRLLEGRQSQIEVLTQSAQQMRQCLQGMQSAIAGLMPRLLETYSPSQNGSSANGVHMNGRAVLLAPPPPTATTATDTLIAEVKSKLAEWHVSAGASEDCPNSIAAWKPPATRASASSTTACGNCTTIG
jgi:hypothetical protein